MYVIVLVISKRIFWLLNLYLFIRRDILGCKQMKHTFDIVLRWHIVFYEVRIENFSSVINHIITTTAFNSQNLGIQIFEKQIGKEVKISSELNA